MDIRQSPVADAYMTIGKPFIIEQCNHTKGVSFYCNALGETETDDLTVAIFKVTPKPKP